MKSRSLLFSFSVIFEILLTANFAFADLRDFDAFAFRQNQIQNQVVLLDFNASWCPVCRVQKPALEAVLEEESIRKRNIKAYLVDFSKAGVLKKRFSVETQATLIIFVGNREVGRIHGIVKKGDLKNRLEGILKTLDHDKYGTESDDSDS